MSEPLNEHYQDMCSAVILRVCENAGDDAAVLRAQAEACTLGERDLDPSGGFISLAVPAELPAVTSGRHVVDAFYGDADGIPIMILLHISDGRLHLLEWYRADGGPPQQWPPPDARAVTFNV